MPKFPKPSPFLTLWVPIILTACASVGTNFDPVRADSLTPGMTLDQVQKQLGKRNSEVIRPDGQRLETWIYSRGTAWGTGSSRSLSLLFDADGKFVRVVSRNQADMR